MKWRPIEGERQCSRCRECKPVSAFGQRGSSYRPACKACESAYNAMRYRIAREGGGKKACRGCGEVKPLDAFSPHAKGGMGCHSHCKACRSAQEAEKQRGGRPPRPEAEQDICERGMAFIAWRGPVERGQLMGRVA